MRRGLLACLALLALASPAAAQRRMVHDTSESGTHHAVWQGTTKCDVVTSSYDGGAVISGTYQQRCNWNGIDGGAPFGHSHTEQFFEDGDIAWTSEYLVRFRYRFDTNIDHKPGSKFLRPSYGSAGAWIVACEFQDGASAPFWMGEGLPSSDWITESNCGDHNEHEFAYYVYKHATNGLIKFWQDGTLKVTYTGDTSNVILSLNVLSNWSLNPGWDHDDLNTAYIDDWEIFTDATSGGEVAAGALSDNSAAVTGGATVPGAPTIGAVTAGNGSCQVAFTAPGSDGGATITGYTATSTPGSFTGTAASSPITVTGLSNGTGYTFTVYATNSAGNSSNSSASATCTPAAAASTGRGAGARVTIRVRGQS